MRMAIASIGWNRAEIQKYSLRYLNKCRNKNKIDLFVFIDGGGMNSKKASHMLRKVRGYNSGPHLIFRDKNLGLSRNILYALREMFESGYDIVCLLEDDVLVSQDFIDYHIYCHQNLQLGKHDIFSVSGYIKEKQDVGKVAAPEGLRLRKWYFPDGVSFSRYVWDKYIMRHITDVYFRDKKGTIDTLKPQILKKEPEFVNKQWVKDGYRHKEQAGYLNAIRAYYGMSIIVPAVSRCQDIGFYGYHQRQKSNKGEKIKDKNNWKKSMWYSKCWSEDYSWDKLTVIVKSKK